MVSFDVTSLFTKVPLDEALQVISSLLREDDSLSERTNMPPDVVCKQVEICLRSTYFQVGDQYYVQVEGATMGSPLSPIVANLYMEAFESRALETAILKPKLWLRYVDDIFAILRYGEEPLNTLHDHLNSQHPAIQFTVEQEVDGRIPLLDILVERKDTSVHTSVFRKTHTDRYINFNSHHHPRILTGVIKCLKDRAVRICHKSKKKRELKHLEKVFRANDFPASMVMKSLHHVHHHTPQTVTDDSKKVLYLPYVRDISERIQQVCRPVGISTVFKSSNTLRQSLVRVKNRTPPEKRKGVVYEIPCQDCEYVYIGETGRTLQKRVTEHRSAVRRFDKNNGIAVHAWNEDHAVDWEAARIISTAPHYWNRRTLEAIHIQQRSPTMNLDCGLHINPIWNPILPASSLPPMSPTPD